MYQLFTSFSYELEVVSEGRERNIHLLKLCSCSFTPLPAEGAVGRRMIVRAPQPLCRLSRTAQCVLIPRKTPQCVFDVRQEHPDGVTSWLRFKNTPNAVKTERPGRWVTTDMTRNLFLPGVCVRSANSNASAGTSRAIIKTLMETNLENYFVRILKSH